MLNFDIDFITMKQLSKFLGVSTQTIVRREDSLFKNKMKKNSNGWRYCDIYEMCEAFFIYWNSLPSWIKMASYLYDNGYKDPEKVNEILLKLRANGKIR
jgi:hypothetical protein